MGRHVVIPNVHVEDNWKGIGKPGVQADDHPNQRL